MGHKAKKHKQKKSIRFQNWDYRNPSYYFLTFNSRGFKHIFGEVYRGVMYLTIPGCIAWHCWYEVPKHNNGKDGVVLDEFIVMPNHIHMILKIPDRRTRKGDQWYLTSKYSDRPIDRNAENIMSEIAPKAGSISTIVRSYKSAVTKLCRRKGYPDFGWNTRYWDVVVRDKRALRNIRRYIRDNPLNWPKDRFYKYFFCSCGACST